MIAVGLLEAGSSEAEPNIHALAPQPTSRPCIPIDKGRAIILRICLKFGYFMPCRLIKMGPKTEEKGEVVPWEDIELNGPASYRNQ
jgi:hypothetical protein